MIGSTIEVIMTWLKLSDEKGLIDFSNYLINEHGDVWSTKRNNMCKHDITRNGYHRVTLYADGKPYRRQINRLVYHMFHPTDSNILDYQVDHEDRNIDNNHIHNLRLADVSQNKLNSKKIMNCSSRFKGVRWYEDKRHRTNSKPWQCEARIFGKRFFFGKYTNEYEAGYVYDQIAHRFHKEFYRNDEFNDCDEHISDERKVELDEYINKRLQKLQID